MCLRESWDSADPFISATVLSVRERIFGTSDLHQFFVHVAYGGDSVLLWRHSDTSCTSGLWMTSYLLIIQGCSTSPLS